MHNIGIIIFDGVEELDAIGPWEVFQVAKQLGAKVQTQLISLTGEEIKAHKGLTIGQHTSFANSQLLDTIVMPGGAGTRLLLNNSEFHQAVTTLAKQCTWLTSVCSGSLVLAAMGCLVNKKATSHHTCYQDLAQLNPTGTVITYQRYVIDGNIITAAGISAGIDMALWLVGQLSSPQLAKKVQAYMEYQPAPPY